MNMRLPHPPTWPIVYTVSASDPLLLQIYGSCTAMVRWRQVLDEVCAETGAVSAVLQGLRVDGSARASPFWMAQDSHIDIEAYQATISDAGNPRLDKQRILNADRSRPLLSDNDLFAAEEEPIRRRLSEQLLNIGLGNFVGGLIPLGDDRYMALALHRRPGDTGDFSTRVLDRVNGLLPHLAQAVSLSHSMAVNRSASALLHGHLDSWPCAMVVCDVNGRVHWLNQQAMKAFRADGELRCPQRQLRAVSGQAQQRLTRALKQAAEEHSQAYAVFSTATGRLHMAVQPLEAHADGIDKLVLVTLTGEDAPGGRIPVEALEVLFDLTGAEARLASALVAGSTVEQYAQQRGVTIGTARYQLNQVLLKTGAHRQADLVRRVLCSAAAHLASPKNSGFVTH